MRSQVTPVLLVWGWHLEQQDSHWAKGVNCSSKVPHVGGNELRMWTVQCCPYSDGEIGWHYKTQLHFVWVPVLPSRWWLSKGFMSLITGKKFPLKMTTLNPNEYNLVNDIILETAVAHRRACWWACSQISLKETWCPGPAVPPACWDYLCSHSSSTNRRIWCRRFLFHCLVSPLIFALLLNCSLELASISHLSGCLCPSMEFPSRRARGHM